MSTLATPAPTTITRARSAAHWQAAAALIRDLAAWTAEAAGRDLHSAQPGFLAELGDLARVYRPPRGCFLLASQDGVAVGSVGLVVHADGRGELKRMYVRPGARGIGAGDALVAGAVQAACELELHSIWLETGREIMETAIGLYRRHGFVERATETPSFDDPRLLTMELVL